MELYSSLKINKIEGLKKETSLMLQNRKKALKIIQDPNYIPNYKYVENSNVL